MDKLDIDKLKNISSNLSNLKSNVDKLDVDKLVLVPVDLSKLSNVVKKTEYDELVKKVKNIKTAVASDLVEKIDYNIKVNEIENKINIDHDHDKYVTS